MKQLVAAACAALLVGAGAALGQEREPDPELSEVRGNRDAYGSLVFLFGDSIMGGYACGVFPPDMSSEDPCWPDRSPAAVLNAVGVPTLYASGNGQPDPVERVGFVNNIERLVAEGVIRPNDIVVLEDAGGHLSDPRAYQEHWIKLRQIFAPTGATVVLTTTPDAIEGDTMGGAPADRFRYDVEFDGVSHNDATRAAAVADVDGAARAVLIDLDALAESPGMLRGDGVHLSTAGQRVLAAAIAGIALATWGQVN